MSFRTRSVLLSLGLLLGACGDDSSVETEPEPKPENNPPVWSNAPKAAAKLGQGQNIKLPVTIGDETPDSVSLSIVSPPAGLEAELSTEGELTLLVHAGYALSGAASLTVELSDGENTTSVEVKLDVVPLRWLSSETWAAADGPEAREHGSVVVDAEGRQAFLVGGSGYSPYLEPFGDVWRYDLAARSWSQLDPGKALLPGASRRVASVPGTKNSYLFGGYRGAEGNELHNELLRAEVVGESLEFTLIEQVNPPPERALHAFAYDPGSQRFVVFGGAGATFYNDVWIGTLTGDVMSWTEVQADEKPKGRFGLFYGMDSESGRLVIYSGQTSQTKFADDTWALDVRAESPTWELLSEGGGEGEPPGRRNGTFLFDPTAPRLFVFGGTSDGATTSPGLFAFDARAGHAGWTRLDLEDQPDLRSSGFGFFDAELGQAVLGFGNTSSAVYADWSVLGY